MKKDNIFIWQDREALSRAAAYFFVKSCEQSIAAHGRFAVALSGGSTPKRLYELLAQPEFSHNINWKKVLLFWGDERFVPHTDEQSNYRMVKESLLNTVKIPKANIFSVPTTGWPQDCAEVYDKTIKNALGRNAAFDLVLLGMGDDGHTASLFPGTNVLEENKKLAKEVWVEGVGKNGEGAWRISITYPIINRSKEIMFLVAGESKKPVLKKIFSGRELKNPYPVQGVQPKNGNAIWMLDEAAIG